jgi:hypothetical protein
MKAGINEHDSAISYDRTFYPPGSNCKGPIGTVVDFSEAIDIDSTLRNGGGGINT